MIIFYRLYQFRTSFFYATNYQLYFNHLYRKKAEDWIVANTPLLTSIPFELSNDETLGFVGNVEKVKTKIGVIHGELILGVIAGDGSGTLEVLTGHFNFINISKGTS